MDPVYRGYARIEAVSLFSMFSADVNLSSMKANVSVHGAFGCFCSFVSLVSIAFLSIEERCEKGEAFKRK